MTEQPQSLIWKLQAQIDESLKGSPDSYGEQCHRRALRDAIGIIHRHFASPEVVERTAMAISRTVEVTGKFINNPQETGEAALKAAVGDV